MPYSDKDKQRQFQREYLKKKKLENPKWNSELRKRHKEKRKTITEIIDHIKASIGCLLCDDKDPKKLQFHHVIPKLKAATISEMISNRSKLIVILKEIDKCVCVCSACHILLHSNIDFVTGNLEKEKWYLDWGVHEALERIHQHPQSRMNKACFVEILKAVIRNSQFHDLKKFMNLKHI